ncbi:unnamed protein product [Strongylus vulgaris]|uniref:Uncharacterized protein n=1 Tax=Strongylus vulgaris TaxID=40348 RepID=A0A3P7INF5_STRVU|nr:unnamed protein product [Strongylus vulgaris]
MEKEYALTVLDQNLIIQLIQERCWSYLLR